MNASLGVRSVHRDASLGFLGVSGRCAGRPGTGIRPRMFMTDPGAPTRDRHTPAASRHRRYNGGYVGRAPGCVPPSRARSASIARRATRPGHLRGDRAWPSPPSQSCSSTPRATASRTPSSTRSAAPSIRSRPPSWSTGCVAWRGPSRSAGVERGDRVALMAENGPHWPIVDFATLCRGAATATVYPTLRAGPGGLHRARQRLEDRLRPAAASSSTGCSSTARRAAGRWSCSCSSGASCRPAVRRGVADPGRARRGGRRPRPGGVRRPGARDRAGRPRDAGLHQRHHRRAEGGDAHPPQHRLERAAPRSRLFPIEQRVHRRSASCRWPTPTSGWSTSSTSTRGAPSPTPSRCSTLARGPGAGQAARLRLGAAGLREGAGEDPGERRRAARRPSRRSSTGPTGVAREALPWRLKRRAPAGAARRQARPRRQAGVRQDPGAPGRALRVRALGRRAAGAGDRRLLLGRRRRDLRGLRADRDLAGDLGQHAGRGQGGHGRPADPRASR